MKSGLYQLILKVVEILAQLLKNQDKREERKKEGRKGKKLKLCTWDFCHCHRLGSPRKLTPRWRCGSKMFTGVCPWVNTCREVRAAGLGGSWAVM